MMKGKVLKLGDFCDFNANSYSGGECWNTVCYLDTGSIEENRISGIQMIDLSRDTLPSRARRKVVKDSILYSTVRPNQRHFGILRQTMPENMLVSTGFAVIDVHEDAASAEYIYYWLRQDSIIEYLQNLAEQSVSAYPSIKASDIAELTIKLPSLPTQRKIAAVLSSLDDKIETNNAICRNLETVGGFMLQHYLEQCNAHVKLSSLMGVENGYAFKSKEYSATGTYKVVTIKNVLDGRVDAMDASGMDEIPADMRPGCRLAVGDVLVSLTGNVGRVGIVTQDKLLLNQRVAKIVPKKKSLLPFLYFYFRNETFKARLEALARGTAQPNLSTTETLALEITADEKGAETLSSSLTPLIWQIITSFQENERLSTLRDTLLPRLMSGEIDVDKVQL